MANPPPSRPEDPPSEPTPVTETPSSELTPAPELPSSEPTPAEPTVDDQGSTEVSAMEGVAPEAADLDAAPPAAAEVEPASTEPAEIELASTEPADTEPASTGLAEPEPPVQAAAQTPTEPPPLPASAFVAPSAPSPAAQPATPTASDPSPQQYPPPVWSAAPSAPYGAVPPSGPYGAIPPNAPYGTVPPSGSYGAVPPNGPAGPAAPDGLVPGDSPVPGAPGQPGYYPQEAYYAAGWAPPAPAQAPRRGHRGLILGITLGLVGLLLVGGGVYAVAHRMRTRPIGDVNGATTATARQVDTGHCIAELPSDGRVSSVRLVPCDEPHEAEVVGMMTIRADSWPGRRTVESDVADWCEMDTAQVEAGFREVTWSPSESSWGQGDHYGVCIAWHEGGDVTGSFAEGDVETS
jgi:hypothetical protein